MWKNQKLWALVVLVGMSGTLLSCTVEPEAAETFEGIWYGQYINMPLRIDLQLDGDQLSGTANVLIPGDRSVPLRIIELEEEGDTLRLKLSGPGPIALAGILDIELRIPKGVLLGEASFGQGMANLPLVMSKDAPELAAQFAGARTFSQEEIDEGKHARLRASCANNLKELGLRMMIFANESRGERYPSPDRLNYLKEDIYPEYLSDPTILMCPGIEAKPEEGLLETEKAQWYFENSRYWYIAHALADEEEAQLYLDASRTILKEGDGNLDIDLDVPDRTPSKIFRLREDVARFIITDISQPRPASHIPSKLPVLIERPGTHEPEGGNVLFMDGHVEYIQYPGKFPMTEAFIEGLISLEELP